VRKISTEEQLITKIGVAVTLLSITTQYTISLLIEDIFYIDSFMPTANNINMTDAAAATESSSPPAPPPPELPPPQPLTGNDGEVLHLIKPDNVKSR